MEWNEDVAAAHLFKLPDQMASEEPTAAGNYNSFVLEMDH
jgi:hypothetical protein